MIGGVIAALTLLPSCALLDMFKGKSSEESMLPSSVERTADDNQARMTGDVIVTINGRPLITTSVLEIEKENIYKSNPQIKAAIAFMDPKVLDRNLTEGLVSQAVVDEYVAEQGLDKSAEYQAELADAYKAIKRMLNAKFFSQKLQVAVTDAQARAFYEEHKDAVPGVMISQGGIVASGIQFDSEATAKDFIAKVKLANNNFARVAQQEGISGTIKDFKMVNSQSVGIDPSLRDKIVAIKTVPSVELISVNGAVWVVNAMSKEAAKYRPFEQVKDKIKQDMENNKRGELFEIEISKLRDKYNIVINEDYFGGTSTAPVEIGEGSQFDQEPRTGGSVDARDRQEKDASKRIA